jgi:hypothetical protein
VRGTSRHQCINQENHRFKVPTKEWSPTSLEAMRVELLANTLAPGHDTKPLDPWRCSSPPVPRASDAPVDGSHNKSTKIANSTPQLRSTTDRDTRLPGPPPLVRIGDGGMLVREADNIVCKLPAVPDKVGYLIDECRVSPDLTSHRFPTRRQHCLFLACHRSDFDSKGFDMNACSCQLSLTKRSVVVLDLELGRDESSRTSFATHGVLVFVEQTVAP